MFTVNTHCIRPHPILQPYVRCFAVRRFDTGLHALPKPMLADHEMTLVFFLHSKLHSFDFLDKKNSLKENRSADCFFTGLQTFPKGFVIFKGATTLLNVHFKPTGFFHIFNFLPGALLDKMDVTEDILSNEILLLQEHMHEAATMGEAVTLLEHFMIKKLLSQKPKYKREGIVQAADLLTRQRGLYSITQLAYHCNMTLQTFEVRFTEYVGLNPKTFSRLLRFGLAVDTKLYQPATNWTEIAHRCGYYDQAHFIKEFKEFAFVSPNKFIKTLNPVLENFEGEEQ